MYHKCRKKIWRFVLFVCAVYVLWIIFLKYTYFSNENIDLSENWKLVDKCDLNTEHEKNVFIQQWSDHLQHLTKNQTTLYNTSKTSCSEKFYPDFESNIRKVLNYKIVKNSPCFDKTSDNHTKHDARVDFPVIVTAASSNHYYESQALFKSIHSNLLPHYTQIKVILYDIGLTENENAEMRKYCKCEVRKFPFHQFSAHVRLREAYAWKPLILFEVLKQYKFVMWVDACIRFRRYRIYNGKLEEMFRKAKLIGIQLQQSPRWTVSKHTKPDTFTILNEPECLFDYPELESGWIVLWKNHFIENVFMRPWVGCALTEHCMTHPYPSRLKPCSNDLWKFILWTRCHRFDQSVLNIILIRIFNRYRKLIEFDGSHIAEILRGNKVNYFSLLHKSSFKVT